MKFHTLLLKTSVFIFLCMLAGPAAAQSKSSSAELMTYDEAIVVEDPAERIAALQRILKTRPAHEQAGSMREAIVASWAQLGEIQLNENNIEKAVANFRQAITTLPEQTTDRFFEETVIRIPLAVSVRGYRNEAVGLARQLEKQFAKEAPRLAALGEFYMTIEAATDAIRALEAAEKQSGEEARLHRALGSAYRMGLRLDDAIAEYQRAIGVDSSDKRAYYELANLYRAHGALADAISLYRKQLEIDPKHAPSFKGLALAYLAQGNEAQMIAALNQARDLRGTAEEITGDIYLQTQMAFYYLAQGKLNKAREASETALMIEPRYAWARLASAEVDLAEGKIFEAERNLLAAERYAGFPTLFFTRGKLYLMVEDFDGAVEQFAKAFSVAGSTTGKDQFTTQLGGSLEVKADNLKELLGREHQAAIFLAASPASPEQFKLAESLTRFHSWLNEIKTLSTNRKATVTRKQMEQLDRAALDFVEVENTRRSFRALYIAQKLSLAGIATGLAVELSEQALAVADIATTVDGSLRDYPNYDRNGRLQIFRGRALDAKGWALFKAGKNEEASTSLAEAVLAYGGLPEGKKASWHLAAVKETAGDMEGALDQYIAGYEPPEVSGGADVKRAVIEVLYRKVNGSLDGLDDRLRQAGIIASVDLTSSPGVQPPEPKTSAQPRETPKPVKLQPKAPRAIKNSDEPTPKSDNPLGEVRLQSRPEPELKAGTQPSETVVEKERENSKAETGDAKDEVLKSSESEKLEARPVVKPIELPVTKLSQDQPVTLAPMFDVPTIISLLEIIKPIASPAITDEIPSPPQRYMRPRRVNLPANKPKPDDQ